VDDNSVPVLKYCELTGSIGSAGFTWIKGLVWLDDAEANLSNPAMDLFLLRDRI
jgi:hypothetical protein